MTSKNAICVAGAGGLVGSNIVRAALARGYTVHGTMRDPSAPNKAPFLNALPGAPESLRLFGADMAEQGYAEIIMPTVNGCMNILRSAVRQGVRNAVICSSTSSTNPVPPVPIKNEVEHWSDENQQCRAKKYTSATKTVMEKAAMKLAAENNVRLSIILPTGMYGPVVLPEHMNGSPHVWLQSLIDGGEGRHKKVPNDSSSMSHLHDLAALFLAAYENPRALGRYFGVYDSWHWQDIYAELQKILPDMKMPEPLTEPPVAPTGFDFTRRDSLGVVMRDIPTMLRQTIEWIQSDPFNSKTN